ncbi:MAG: sulfatase [Phycisphaerae bacterium]|nr:sulfatase [Phycisphaerae bacterium]
MRMKKCNSTRQEVKIDDSMDFIRYGVGMLASLLLTALLMAPEQPNFVLVMVDDLGWQDTSLPLHEAPTPFNARYWTPHLEQLARNGMAFTNAYAAGPVCTPTRTSLMTGQSPGRTHITYWTLRQGQDTSRPHPTLKAPEWQLNGLKGDEDTLPALLEDGGYQTIHVGKAHFGAHDTPAADPLNLGFHRNIAGHASGAPASFYGKHDFSRAGRTGKEGPGIWDVPGLDAYHGQDIYLTEALTEEALKEIDLSVEEDKPFFLHFAPYAVHTPIMPNPRHLDRYTDRDPKEAAYATMIQSYDEALGAILDRLEHHGIQDNTIVIFTSDNGGLSAHARGGKPHLHNAPLRSGKGSAYEGGIRVPTVIHWPGRTEPGTRSDAVIVTYDLFPTILAAAGVSTPDGKTLDGHDLSSILSGEIPDREEDRIIGWNQPHQWGASGPGIEPFTSIRQGAWKLIYFHAGPRFELYDLEHDLGETIDLAESNPDRVRAMAEVMTQWINETGAQLSRDLETGQPIQTPAEAAGS